MRTSPNRLSVPPPSVLSFDQCRPTPCSQVSQSRSRGGLSRSSAAVSTPAMAPSGQVSSASLSTQDLLVFPAALVLDHSEYSCLSCERRGLVATPDFGNQAHAPSPTSSELRRAWLCHPLVASAGSLVNQCRRRRASTGRRRVHWRHPCARCPGDREGQSKNYRLFSWRGRY